MVKDNFPIRLKEARLMMGFSMDKLVERAGGAITKQSISRYERGIMHPKHKAQASLAKLSTSAWITSMAPVLRLTCQCFVPPQVTN